MPEEPPTEHGDAAPVRVYGFVDRIDDGIAVVTVGPDEELWDFPLEILPGDVRPESVLVLERLGRRLRFVELDPVTELVSQRVFDDRLRRSARKVPHLAAREG